MDHRLLIVGGTGFIGRNLVLNALEKGLNIVVVSLNKSSSQQKIEGVDYLQMDITKPIQTSNQLTETPFDYVVNLSGYIDHCRFLEGGRKLIKAHFEGVQNLLQLLDWSKLKRFVQVGSSDEYGNHPPPQHEKMRELPISPYSLGKVASTQFLQMLHRTQDFPAVIVRLFLTYGPGQDNKRFFPATIKGCLSDDPFPTSAGEQLRDFCYVDDIAQGILSILTNEQVNGEIINLASGNPVTIRDATELIQKTLGRGAPEFGKIPYRIGENMALYADISKAKRILGWKPVVAFEDGVERTINEYLVRMES